jgi:hypothetical protein
MRHLLTATLRAEKPVVNTISAEGRAYFHATILHLMDDHERLSDRHAGLDVRLTGVEHAHVVKEILA